MPRLLCFSLLLVLLLPDSILAAPGSDGNGISLRSMLSAAGKDSKTVDVELSRRVDTLFNVQPGLRLELDNRYGNTTFSVWEKNQVKVEIDIRVRESEDSKAQETLRGIHCQQVLYSSFLRLETVFDTESNGIKRAVQNLNPFERSSIDVDYRITLPAYTICDISNQFGDVYVEGLTSAVSINLRYGDLRSQSLAPGSRIGLDYAKAIIGNANECYGRINNSELEIRETSAIELEAEGSKIRIEKAGRIRLNSRKDDLRIGTVKELTGLGRFTDLKVDEIQQTCDLEWSLGTIDIAALALSFSELRLEQRNTNVRVNIGRHGFALQAYLEGGQLVVPKEIGSLKVDVLDEKNKIRSLTGIMAPGPGFEGGKGRIALRGKDGEFVLYR